MGDLVPGDEIVTGDSRGHALTFVVRRLEQVDKYNFPTAEVYGNTGTPELRLLTCGGDYTGGEYEENLIVFATLR